MGETLVSGPAWTLKCGRVLAPRRRDDRRHKTIVLLVLLVIGEAIGVVA